ncbi:6-pyruvoyl trahydropterin synthase family protein [Paraferrimonas haliotis]|uniref:6-carboxy-5,6,7,8-tetrahydropterin synthase n=1 Tax=Paraferrimonas haliotis TaxID=2013866 RepID=A0AA37WX68_9GAMM|nr:6-carboxytetrahydropterin synthase [Paraferrimonas haliotis]GLS84348.1 hypothetical protein GCM10007894_23250 [Paraferrimonas haliotis]
MKLFVKDLTVADFSYLCPKRGMVGESWSVDVTLTGGLDEQNMVLDFSKVKKRIKQVIDELVDHRLLVPTSSASCRWQQKGQTVWVDFETEKGDIYLSCPAQAYALIPNERIDEAAVVEYLTAPLLEALPTNVLDLELSFRAEHLATPYYHYSHGLKRHDGNCQRIAHGHRSPVEVYLNKVRSEAMERYWANRWQDRYLGSEEDLVALESLTLSSQCEASVNSHYGFCYQAPQGCFQLAIPMAICDIIPTDTTVELLAQYMAQQTAELNHYKNVEVVAYEGIGKGAIAFCQIGET